jgi:hypothetical protein
MHGAVDRDVRSPHHHRSARHAETDPGAPLPRVLRDEVGLTGTRCGCAVAACGACTVHASGQPGRACVTSVSAPSHAIKLKEGRFHPSTFTDLPLPRIGDLPKIGVHIVPSDALRTGMGDSGLPLFAPVLANAIRRATRRAQRALPSHLA